MRGAASLHVVGELDAAVDLLGKLAAVDRRLDVVPLDAGLFSQALEVFVFQLRVRVEDGVVHVPEALVAFGLVGEASERRRRLGARVEGQRVVLPDEAHVLRVRRSHLLQRVFDALAEGALEVREDDHGHERVLRALDRIVVLNEHLPDALVFFFGVRRGLVRRRGLGHLVLVGERDVHVGRLGAAGDELLGLGQLGVDHLGELVDRLGAAQRDAVDAERGRAAGINLLGQRQVFIDFGGVLLGSVGGLVLDQIDAGFLGPLLRALVAQRLLVGESGVVELPEGVVAGEPKDRRSGFGRGARVVVEGQRVVLPDDTDLVRTVLLPQLRHRRLDAAAEGALEVADLGRS